MTGESKGGISMKKFLLETQLGKGHEQTIHTAGNGNRLVTQENLKSVTRRTMHKRRGRYFCHQSCWLRYGELVILILCYGKMNFFFWESNCCRNKIKLKNKITPQLITSSSIKANITINKISHLPDGLGILLPSTLSGKTCVQGMFM